VKPVSCEAGFCLGMYNPALKAQAFNVHHFSHKYPGKLIMPNNLMNFNHQVNSEEITQEVTKLRIPAWFLRYPDLLNALFEVTYFIGKTDDATSPEGHFYTLGYNTLIQFPYTIRASSILLEKGFYFEAIILVRNLYESFFQLRYFHKHKDAIFGHWTIKKNKVLFKQMFDEIAPGFYQKIYGEQFSQFAHSGVSSSMFRTTYSSPEVGETTMGSNYHELGCMYTINKIIVILYGALNYVPILFPLYSSLVTDETEHKRKEALIWLESVMKADIEEKPEIQEFYDLVHPLIY